MFASKPPKCLTAWTCDHAMNLSTTKDTREREKNMFSCSSNLNSLLTNGLRLTSQRRLDVSLHNKPFT